MMTYDRQGQAEGEAGEGGSATSIDVSRFSLNALLEFQAEAAEEIRMSSRLPDASPIRNLPELRAEPARIPQRRETVDTIPLDMQVVIGRKWMTVAQTMQLLPGSIVELERRIGEPLEIIVNGRIIAYGEIVLLDEADGRFGVKIVEVRDQQVAGISAR